MRRQPLHDIENAKLKYSSILKTKFNEKWFSNEVKNEKKKNENEQRKTGRKEGHQTE